MLNWFDTLTEIEQNELTYLLEQVDNLVSNSDSLDEDDYDEYTDGRLHKAIYDVMYKAKLWC